MKQKSMTVVCSRISRSITEKISSRMRLSW